MIRRMAADPEYRPTIFPARNGEPSARVGSVHLHSSFDPSAEAERFVDSNLKSAPAAAVVVLGAGLGYLTRRLRQIAPSARIITVDYHTGFRSRRVCEPDAAWDPAGRRTLRQFLYEVLPEEELAGLILLDWRPAAQAAGLRADTIIKELRDTVAEMNANAATSGYFARRWFRNASVNFLLCERFVEPPTDGRPIVIAASGPTLERAAPALLRLRDRLNIWALPSAFAPLHARGIIADMIVLTDPGFYGGEHLWSARAKNLPVAAPLTAARGLWRAAGGVVLLDQGTPVERVLNAASGTAALPADPNGTVAGTALELALSLTAGPVIFAGFDLSTDDLLSHASPHSFDRYIRYRAARLLPYPTRLFERNIVSSTRIDPGSRARVSRAHATFADWITQRGGGDRSELSGPTRLFRLRPSSVPLPIAEIDDTGLEQLCAPGAATAARAARTESVDRSVERYRLSLVERPSRRSREIKLRELLGTWKEAVDRLPALAAEGLLFSAANPTRAAAGFLDPAAMMRIRRLLAADRKQAVREAERARAELSGFLTDAERTYLRMPE